MSEVRREVVLGGLRDFERRILSDYPPSCLPPFTMLRDEHGDKLLYDLSGLVPIDEVVLANESDLFFIVEGFVFCLMNLANSLLSIGGVSADTGSIYVDDSDRFKVIVCGVAGRKRSRGYGNDENNIYAENKLLEADRCNPTCLTKIDCDKGTEDSRKMISKVAMAIGDMGYEQGLANSRICARQIADSLHIAGAGLRDMQKQIELVHREWDCILYP